MGDFPQPIPRLPTAEFRPRSAIEQVTCLFGVEGSANGSAEDLAADLVEDLVAEEAGVGGGRVYLPHRVILLFWMS